MPETGYEDRTDSFEKKEQLLLNAYREGNLDLCLSLLSSMKDTLALERQRQAPGDSVSKADDFLEVRSLPTEWATWAHGWQYCKGIVVKNPTGLERRSEPVDIRVSFPESDVTDPSREVRVTHVTDGTLREVTSQVCDVWKGNGECVCRVIFQADVPADGQGRFMLFYGNPYAERPAYATSLRVQGEGYGLDIQNLHYTARLSRQTGQLERLTYRTCPPKDDGSFQQQHGLELYAGGEGHGEPPHIDWAHDYKASNQFQKFRITNWSTCPNYEVVQGPLCVQVRRWGFPHSPAHPLFTPARMHIDVEYTFYAGLPYFTKTGRMEMIQDFELSYLRDDEWVFSGYSFDATLWMDKGGTLHEGAVPQDQKDDLWGVGFYSTQSRDAFIALYLEHGAEHFDRLYHCGAPLLDYRGHGQVWSRWAARDTPQFKAGAVLKQRNAYLVSAYHGASEIEGLRERLLNPIEVTAAAFTDNARPPAGQLARPGETAAEATLKDEIWAAMREIQDGMFYRVDANVVDMGYIYDVEVKPDRTVRVLMTMPHRGRPMFGFLANPLRHRLLQLNGVRDVVVEFTWEPAWTVARLTARGREAMGLR